MPIAQRSEDIKDVDLANENHGKNGWQNCLSIKSLFDGAENQFHEIALSGREYLFFLADRFNVVASDLILSIQIQY